MIQLWGNKKARKSTNHWNNKEKTKNARKMT